MYNFAYNNKSGRISVISFSDPKLMYRVPKDSIKISNPVEEEDPSSEYWDSYIIKDKKIIIDLEKAKEIRLNYLKNIRNNKLQQLDTEQLIALGRGNSDEVKELEQIKQTLRDITDKINWSFVKSLYDIRHILPPELA